MPDEKDNTIGDAPKDPQEDKEAEPREEKSTPRERRIPERPVREKPAARENASKVLKAAKKDFEVEK